jgi:hypothetical protein
VREGELFINSERIDLVIVKGLGMSRICFHESIFFQGENLINDASIIQLSLLQWGCGFQKKNGGYGFQSEAVVLEPIFESNGVEIS